MNPTRSSPLCYHQAELEPAIGQEVHRRGLTRHQHGVAEVVVEHMRADPEACRRLCGADQRRHRRQEVGEVIGYGQRRVAEVLERAGLLGPLGPRARARRSPRTETASFDRVHGLVDPVCAHVSMGLPRSPPQHPCAPWGWIAPHWHHNQLFLLVICRRLAVYDCFALTRPTSR